MSIRFSERPGRHERHYRRRVGNPLYAAAPAVVDDAALLDAQRRDHDELLAFVDELRATLQRAVDLPPNAGSDVVLEIKEDLDRLYETSAGLAEDHAANQAAIAELLDVIMRNIERGAAGDPQALAELAQERVARETHCALLRSPLVADLLHPDSCIASDELAPCLLSADDGELGAALQLFDHAQLAQLHDDARRCLAACAVPPATAVTRLERIAAQLARVHAAGALN
ncbi:MAG: hypothetical protein QNJ91_14230 [Gammaproteobacteria bacterium]|nr:hypothetical protein [Gammaproteobacteria bacterium]